MAAVRAIEAYLRDHERYRLDSPVPGLGEDSVDNFLFTAHSGFCEQFASAEVVLARSVGIPARLVTGYAVDANDAATVPGAQSGVVVRGTSAHAWVEVSLDGASWVTSDPTAGAPMDTSPAPQSWWSVLGHRLGVWSGPMVVGGVVIAGAGMVLLLRHSRWTLLLTGISQRRARWVFERAQGSEVRAVMSAVRRFETRAARRGFPRRPGESLTEFAKRLCDQGVVHIGPKALNMQ